MKIWVVELESVNSLGGSECRTDYLSVGKRATGERFTTMSYSGWKLITRKAMDRWRSLEMVCLVNTVGT